MGVINLLTDLVSIKSEFPGEGEVAHFIGHHLKRNGFSVSRQYLGRYRFNLLARKGKSPKVIFYGHMDTVPLYGKWKTDPFVLTKKGDRLFGLGSEDMKGGISAIIEAAKNSDYPSKLIFCVDEENISRGAWHAVKHGRQWFSEPKVIISGESGTSEKSSGGVYNPTLARRGRCVISISIAGKSAHGAMPERGRSAIDAAAMLVIGLNKMQLRNHPKLGSESIFVRRISSSSTSLSVPETAELALDVHLVPPSTNAEILARVNSVVGRLRQSGSIPNGVSVSVRLEKRDTPYLEPYMTSDKVPAVSSVLSAIKRNFGRMSINYAKSVADENVFAKATGKPVIAIGPMGRNGHASNEWVSEQSLHQSVKLYSAILENVY